MSKQIENRWSKWFPNNTIYINLLQSIEKYVDTKSKDDPQTDYFTPHDSSHCLAVEKIVKALINKSVITLSELEKFVLFSSIWVHDIGMFEDVAKSYFANCLKTIQYDSIQKRERHADIAAWYINQDNQFRSIFKENRVPEGLLENYIHSINILNKFHRRKEDIKDCPLIRYIRGEKINARLLACLIRLGDTLHVDTSRYDRKLYSILQIGDFDRTARLHWLKSYVVSAVHLDIGNESIFVTIDLPEPKKDERFGLKENAERLKFIIHENIYEDLEAVSNTFKENKYPFYTSIKVDVDYCPGFEKDRRDELIGILNDLDIVLSPNTSKVIKKSLDSISSLAKMDFTKELFRKQTDEIIKHLEKIFIDRPCHVGLHKIIEMIKGLFEQFKKEQISMSEFQTKLLQNVENINTNRENAQKEINKKSVSCLKNIENIFLFGYSEMVCKFLSANSESDFKNNVKLYVFECGGKRKFSIGNSIEYNDGIHYSIELSKLGFKNIKILPETSFTSLINDSIYVNKETIKSNSLLLFGANGIDEITNDCGHTSGHLMLAITAKHYCIPVKVVADKYKIGEIEWKPSLTRKEKSWLTGQKNIIKDLESREIEMINYREDRISKKFIDEIICED